MAWTEETVLQPLSADASFYDVSWLVSGMVVRQWDSFCASSPPGSASSMEASSSPRPAYLDEATVMMPPLESFESLMPGLRQCDMGILGSEKASYALRSSHFRPSIHDPCPVPTLWIDDQQSNDDILNCLRSSTCSSISRLIIADVPSDWISSLLDALRASWPDSSIRHLGFYNCSLSEDHHWNRLIDMLSSPRCPIQSLLFAHLPGLSGVYLRSLTQILQDPESKISELLIHGASKDFPRKSFQRLLKVLQNETVTLQRLSLTSCRLRDEHVEDLSSFLKSHRCKIRALNLSANPFSELALQALREAIVESQRPSSSTPSGSRSCLEMLSLCGSSSHTRDEKVTNAITSVLEDPNCILHTLDLTGRSADAGFLLDLAQILCRQSCRLRTLYLFHVPDQESGVSANKKLIDALKFNTQVTTLQFPWATEEYKQIADILLQRNKRFQCSGLRHEKLTKARCAKVFLLGHEGVGKSTLRKNLLSSKLKNKAANAKKRFFNPRRVTHGMKLSTLQLETGKTRAVVCDIAGQREYHALHHLFMTSSNEDLFVIVCKYEDTQASQPDVIGFNARLEYWLRFIVSHRAHSHPKPTVMVVVNFFNSEIKASDRLGTAKFLTESAVRKYECVLDFGKNASNVFGVELTAVSYSECTLPVKERLTALVSKLIRRRNPILKICDDIPAAVKRCIESSARKGQSTSMVTTVRDLLKIYKELCAENAKCLPPSSEAAFEEALLDLHKICQVVFFKSSAPTKMLDQMVILDPEWFYKTLVGCFVEPKMRLVSSSSRSTPAYGVWNESEIKIHMTTQGKCATAHVDDILRYLKMLDIFYVVQDDLNKRLLLFPTILPDTDENQAADWHADTSCSSSDTVRFLGRRLKCEDAERSLLPWGVFTRLQVQLHKVYGSDRKYTVSYGSIRFVHNDVDAYIRFGGAGKNQWEDCHWIDVMVRYCVGLHDNDGTRDMAADEIISTSRKLVLQFCQGLDKRFAGITLQECALLDSSCHESVLLSKAKEQVHLEGIEGHCGDNWFRGDARVHNTRVSKLFVVTDVKEFSRQNVAAIRHLREDFALHDSAAMAQLSSVERPIHDLLRDENQAEMGCFIRKLVHQLNEARETVYALVSEKLIRREVAVTGEALPECPYLMDSKGAWEKLTVLANVKRARLHLMCETYKGCHRVKEQKGVTITIQSPDWIARIAPVLIPGLKLVYGAAKIGTSIFLPGVNTFIPEADNLFMALGLPDKISLHRHSQAFPMLLSSYVEGLPNVQQNLNALSGGGLAPLSLLRDFYKYALEGKEDEVVMERDFSLHRVYFPAKGKSIWVCKHHLQQGLREERAELLAPLNPFQFLEAPSP